MKPLSVVIAGLILTACASFGYSQSLADLAKKEKERRAAVKTEVKVINNEKAAQSVGTSAPAQPATTATEAPAAPGTPKPAAEAQEKPKPGADEPVDFQGRTEGFWRQTFADARKRVSDLENQTNVIILKLNDLHNQFYRENDGYKQQAIQREIQKTIYEQDTVKANLEKAKGDLVDLEREARKSGALPGWIRDN